MSTLANAPTLTLLHLSDLHFGQARGEATARFDQKLVTQALLEDVQGLVKEGLNPDYIVLTGDVAFSAQPEEYQAASGWLRALCRVCGLETSRLLMVPGNHDVDRKKVLGDFLQQITHQNLRSTPAKLDELLAPKNVSQLEIALWPKLQAYASFAHSLEALSITAEHPFWQVELSNPFGKPVIALGLNTCLLSFDGADAPSNLALGLGQLQRAFEKLPDDALVLALLHHPPEWLVDGAPGPSCRPEHALTTFLQKLPHVLLVGHVHAQGGLVSHPLHTGGLVRFVAGAGHESVAEGGRHTYAWVRVHGAGLDFYPRSWNPAQQRFQPEANRFELEKGQHYARLKRSKLADKLEKWLEPLENRPSISHNVPHAFVPSAWTSWAQKEYDTLTPLIATQSPISFRLERVYVELHSRWQAPEELQAAQKRGKKRGKKTGPDARHEQSSPPRRSIPALLEATTVRLLALKGGPGSGKSTALRRLLLSRLDTRGADTGPKDSLLPLYLELKELGVWLKAHPNGGTSPEQLLTWAGERLEKHGLSAEALMKRSGHGRILWLLDGLDEIFQDELRLRAAQLIGGFFKHAPGNTDRLLITGRPHAFDDARVVCALGLENRVADLDELTDDERAEFLQKWFAEVYPHNAALAQEQAEALTRAIPQHEQVNALSRTPLLLSTMAAVYHMGRVLPERRADLYHHAVDVMLNRRFGSELKPGDYSQRATRRAMTVVAQRMMEAGEVRSLSRLDFERALVEVFHPVGATEEQQNKLDELVQWLGAQSGLLALRGDPLRFTFSHLSFQEFLCAEWYASQGEPLEALGKRLDEPFWREVVLLTGGRLLMEGLGQLGERFLVGLQERSGSGERTAWRSALLANVVMEAPDGSLPVGFAEKLKPRLVEVMGGQVEPSTYGERVVVGQCLGKLGDPRLGLEKEKNWIYFPPGEFRMGSEDGDDNEKPIHQVTLKVGFYLSRFLVTNHDFRPFVEGDGYRNKKWWSSEGWAWRTLKGQAFEDYFQGLRKQFDWLKDDENWRATFRPGEQPRFWQDAELNAPNQPVVGLSCFEAEAFCAWLSAQQQKPAFGEGPGKFRLPTEAEWEYAARGKEGRNYPWGHDAPTPERANFRETGLGRTSPVGAFPQGATKEGLLDLAGNVWEWCQDWYGPYSSSLQNNSTGLATGSNRVVRGGGWDDNGGRLRAAFRLWSDVGGRGSDVGFRVVRSVSRAGGP